MSDRRVEITLSIDPEKMLMLFLGLRAKGDDDVAIDRVLLGMGANIGSMVALADMSKPLSGPIEADFRLIGTEIKKVELVAATEKEEVANDD